MEKKHLKIYQSSDGLFLKFSHDLHYDFIVRQEAAYVQHFLIQGKIYVFKSL